MKRWLVITAILALVSARPETYREKEDFQFSRSSTDEGSKSGYYGAQRGNMGGNYERAHNMDRLAQHQMSGVVRQVEGELGDAANTRTGNVFSAASTKGMYGQGNYDLSNLEGRNFQEGVSHADSSSHSSSASQSARYSGRSSSYLRHGSKANTLESDDLQRETNYNNRHSDYGSSYQARSQNVAQEHHSAYEQSATDLQSHGQQRNSYDTTNYGSRFGSATPTRVIIRPGNRVALPVTAQIHDDTQRLDSVNADAELLHNADSVNTAGTPKYYESSYNYRKEWERHNVYPAAAPLAITTSNPYEEQRSQDLREYRQRQNSQSGYISNSRLTENYGSVANGLQAHEGLSTSHNTADAQSSRQAHYDTDYNQNHRTSSSSASDLNLYNRRHSNLEETSIDANQRQSNVDTRPKSYQSSYSYHKSWERQGDPYTIRPATGTSENLQALSSDSSANRNTYTSHRHDSNQYRHQSQRSSSAHSSDIDCDDQGHIRVARSYHSFQTPQETDSGRDGSDNESQQSQNEWGRLENFGQQSEDIGQQTQTNFENLDNFNHQSQGTTNNLEDSGQQFHTDFGNFEVFGQQAQSVSPNFEDLGQQIQTSFENLEDFNQRRQGVFANEEGQQIQTDFGNLEVPTQRVQPETYNRENLSRQTQTDGGKSENFEQEVEISSMNGKHLGQQTQNHISDLEQLNQQVQEGSSDLEHLTQQTETGSSNSDNLQQQIRNTWSHLEDLGQQTQKGSESIWDQISQKENENHQTNFGQMTENSDTKRLENEFNSYGNTPFSTSMKVLPNFWYNNYNFHSSNESSSDHSLHGNSWNGNEGRYQSRFGNSFQITETENSYHNSNFNRHNSDVWGNSALDSLWSKIDELEKNNTQVGANEENIEQKQNVFRDDQKPDSTSITSLDTSKRKDDKVETVQNSRDVNSNDKNNDVVTENHLVKSINFGRGDIESDDSSEQSETTTYKNTRSVFNTPRVSVMNMFSSTDKPYKTPEEIESLSLITPINKTITTENNLQADHTGIIDLENNYNVRKNQDTSQENINIHSSSENQENEFSGSYYSRNNFNHNPQTNNEQHIAETERNDIKKDYNTELYTPEAVNQKNMNFEQHSEGSSQQLENLDQLSQTEWNEHNKDNLENFGQHVQSSWNPNGDLVKQSQTDWNQNEELGQEAQTVWNPTEESGQHIQNAWNSNENLEQLQQNFDQTNNYIGRGAKYERQNKERYQNEKHPITNLQEKVHKKRSSETSNSQKETGDMESTNVITISETCTDIPGFWQSVGNKFINAKNIISSWFSNIFE